MAYAPDGRVLSPGEVYEEQAEVVQAAEWTEDLNVLYMCPDCKENPPNLVEEFSSGDTVCGSCGRVLADRIIDTRSEWRTFSNDDQGNDDPSRVGDAANPLLHGSQLQTEIGFGDGGMRVRELSRAQNKSNHDKTNKWLQSAYGQITTLCESHNIPKVVAETAKLLFKRSDDDKIFKGKSQEAIIASCIFFACRQHDVPRSFREIYKLTNVSKKEIGRQPQNSWDTESIRLGSETECLLCFPYTFQKQADFISSSLGRTYKILEAHLRKMQKSDEKKPIGALPNAQFAPSRATVASDLIARACNKLNLEQKISIIAQEVATKVTNIGVAAGRSPLSITGASIYLVSHLMGAPRTPKDIGLAVDVSDGTIRTTYKLIHTAIDQIMDGEDEWIRRGGDKSRIPLA